MLGEFPANFSANSSSVFFRERFGLVFGPPKNSRPKSVGVSLQFQILSPNIFHSDFLLAGETKTYIFSPHGRSVCPSNPCCVSHVLGLVLPLPDILSETSGIYKAYISELFGDLFWEFLFCTLTLLN